MQCWNVTVLSPLQAASWLLSVPGASNTVLEAGVPYARDSLLELIGKASTTGVWLFEL